MADKDLRSRIDDDTLRRMRERAEDFLRHHELQAPGERSEEDVASLLHELNVYHVELELQNEELRNSQHELDRQRKRLDLIFSEAPVGYLTLRSDGSIKDVNRHARELFAFPHSIKGVLLEQFVLRKDVPTLQLALTRSRKQEVRERCDVRYAPFKSGSLRWLRVTCQPMPGGEPSPPEVPSTEQQDLPEEGDRDLILCVLEDITREKQYESSLVQAKRGMEVEVQERTRELQRGNTELSMAKEELESRVQERTRDLRRANEALSREIEERERIAAAMLASEQRFKALFASQVDAVFLVRAEEVPEGRHDSPESGADGAIVAANQAACELYGYDCDELRSLSLRHFEARKPAWAGAAAAAEGTLRFHRRRDGSVFPVEMVVGGFEQDGAAFSIVLVRDVSERQQAQRLQRMERDLGAALLQTRSMGKSAELTLDAVLAEPCIDGGCLHLVGSEGGLELLAARGFTRKDAVGNCLGAWEAWEEAGIHQGTALWMDAVALQETSGAFGRLHQEGVRCLAVLPIWHDGRVFAGLSLFSRSVDAWPPQVRSAMEVLVVLVGGSIARCQAEAALQQANQELEKDVRRRIEES